MSNVRSHEMSSVLRSRLKDLADVLTRLGSDSADPVAAVATADDRTLHEYLRSNELWGGSGSVADQAGVESSRETAREVETALVVLGRAQLAEGVVNPRTASWVEVFEDWRRRAI